MALYVSELNTTHKQEGNMIVESFSKRGGNNVASGIVETCRIVKAKNSGWSAEKPPGPKTPRN